MEPLSSPTPECLLDTVNFKSFEPRDVKETLLNPNGRDCNMLKDPELVKRVLERCVDCWIDLKSDRDNARR